MSYASAPYPNGPMAQGGLPTADALGGLSRIYDALLTELPGVPLPVLEMAVFDAIEEFCRRSLIYRQTLQVTFPVGVAIIDINPVSDHTLVEWILRVNGFRSYELRPPAILIDHGDTTVVRRGTVLVACKPTRLDYYGAPDFLVSMWGQAIRDGARHFLYGLPERPWSSAKLSEFYGRRFWAKVVLAKETVRAQGDLPRPRFPYFASGAQRGWGLAQYSELAPHFGTGTGPFDVPMPDSPLPLNDGEADVDGGGFTTDPEYNDVDGGTF